MTNIIVKLKKIRELGATEKAIANYVLDNVKKIENIDIRDFANNLHSSTAQISRFVKKLGFNGFIEFKYEIKNYLSTINKFDESEGESNDPVFSLIKENVDYLSEWMNNNLLFWKNNNNFLTIVEQIKKANKIYIFANGGTYSVAYDLFIKLQRLGFNAIVSNDNVVQETLVSAHFNLKGDLFIIFSLSGSTKNLVDVAKKISKTNNKLISFTGSQESSIKSFSDYNISIFNESNTLKSLIGGSRILFLFMTGIIIETLIKNSDENYTNNIIKTAK